MGIRVAAMIPLETRGAAHRLGRRLIGRVTTNETPFSERDNVIRLARDGEVLELLAGYLGAIGSGAALVDSEIPVVTGCEVAHLEEGDVVAIDPSGFVRTLYRRQSRSNTLFATERCNSFCLMCSQPPRQVDDSWRIEEMLRVIELADRSTAELGITGGEPTLLGEGLVRVVATSRDRLPTTALHILSNGRAFKDQAFARMLAEVGHPDLMVGIPLYSDVDSVHDYVVQARGAYAETLEGLHNLGLCEIPTEIRVVVHRATYKRLPRLATFIARNLPFASHVAFMGLEVIGFAKANFHALWIDPIDYADELEEAALYLANCGLVVSVYNHQLCTLPRTLWPFSRQSISDWKNEYDAVCEGCGVRRDCGGFFAWNLHSAKSRGVKPILTDTGT